MTFAEGTVDTAVGSRRYRLVWPPEFPLRPPVTWELSADGADVIDHRAHGYTFRDLSLCLFAHDPRQGWRPEYTAGEALDRLVAYLEQEAHGEFPRIEDIPLTTDFIRVSVPLSIAAALRQGGGWGILTVRGRKDGRLLRVMSVDGTSPSPIITRPLEADLEAPWVAALGLDHPRQGLWCRINKTVEQVPSSRHRLEGWIRQQLPNEHARQLFMAQALILLVLNDGLRFVLIKAGTTPDTNPEERLIYVEPFEENLEERIFRRVDDRLGGVGGLQRAQVAIVGVGSLGSSVAVVLAKAGVSKFVLLDPELLDPENVARHVGGVDEICLPKVEVVSRAIHRINPAAEVVQVQAALSLDPVGWGKDPTQHLIEVTRHPLGIIVCATATTEAESVVNHLCVIHACPGIFTAVLGRAEHGRVFRVLPGVTPCYQCVLNAQYAEPGRFPRFDRVDMGVPAYQQQGLPGLGMDVEQVALITARMTLQTLGERSEGELDYPKAHGDHLIWSNHGGWAVDGPLQTRVELIPRDRACPVCGIGNELPLSLEEEKELAALQVDRLKRS
ncbi:ThiF family adenylyltransferase [Melittangium boletus]|uniref:Thiamine biosynthesis protein ThiF n=1 Tax=Melittangium boletus DSM 14713 TaxID=1294270 RepID=A0A250INE2_9BACT|nr:ThiF family adenylyltransferase [Melittangium boletus]ATB32456.1 thiamine biosynthesis protein ThiF [Melittangium boletus DSM 14713]